MRKLAAMAVLVAVGLAAPAQAEKPDRTGKPDKRAEAQKAGKPAKAKGRCGVRSVGFNASGTLVESALTAGDGGLLSGTVTVDVKRANHGAPKGVQTYTLTNVRVRFREGVDGAAPAAGSPVKLSGKIAKRAKKCPADGFEPTVTVKRVEVRAAETAGADEAKKADADEAQTAGAEEAKTADVS
ncbi:MAG: hypothetical protein H0W96_11140 [Solirubrobacterales bacterium]|nr:hypothetical protein [Solirubrobacterales bacterium]